MVWVGVRIGVADTVWERRMVPDIVLEGVTVRVGTSSCVAYRTTAVGLMYASVICTLMAFLK